MTEMTLLHPATGCPPSPSRCPARAPCSCPRAGRPLRRDPALPRILVPLLQRPAARVSSAPTTASPAPAPRSSRCRPTMRPPPRPSSPGTACSSRSATAPTPAPSPRPPARSSTTTRCTCSPPGSCSTRPGGSSSACTPAAPSAGSFPMTSSAWSATSGSTPPRAPDGGRGSRARRLAAPGDRALRRRTRTRRPRARAHALRRSVRDALFWARSPLPSGDPPRGAGVPYWAHDPALRPARTSSSARAGRGPDVLGAPDVPGAAALPLLGRHARKRRAYDHRSTGLRSRALRVPPR